MFVFVEVITGTGGGMTGAGPWGGWKGEYFIAGAAAEEGEGEEAWRRRR